MLKKKLKKYPKKRIEKTETIQIYNYWQEKQSQLFAGVSMEVFLS